MIPKKVSLRWLFLPLLLVHFSLLAQHKFKVLAFYTAKNDPAHISFVNEANRWFASMASKHRFSYDTTSNWDSLNTRFISNYQVLIFLDTRPDSSYQRKAFREYMEHGGAWMGFHFSAFALTPSAYPQNWDWYHNELLGSGAYAGNTWRPTAAVLKVEDKDHASMKGLPTKWRSAPNEWYKWQKDLRTNPKIKILLSIDSSSFPLGTGPKQHEIWPSGYYPVAWTNTRYRMIYFNMGHNDMDYEHGTNKELSYTFQNEIQNKCVLNALLWLGSNSKH